MRNIRLDIEYDGTRYSGWQRQENGPSVQAEIEDVLSKVLQEPVSIIGAGRTDAGVHARGQVANFHTESVITTDKLTASLNSLLPDDVVIHRVSLVPAEFHARYSAISRRYSYTISQSPSALQRAFIWHLRYPFDLGLLDQAAAIILDQKDFRAFCRTGSEVNHHKCEVSLSRWTKDGAILRYDIRANRFLYGMVRALVGTMVDIGRGFRRIEDLQSVFSSGDRTKAGPAAPAAGLVLEEIGYPPS